MQSIAPTNVVEIALPVPLRQSFSYLAPKGQAAPTTGQLVLAPFGSRDLVGVVIPKTDKNNYDHTKLKELKSCYNTELAIPEELLRLCLWLTHYYQHPLGEVLQSSIPPQLRQGKTPTASQQWQLTTEGKGLPETALKRSPKQQEILLYLQKHHYFLDEQRSEIGFNTSTLKALTDKKLIEKCEAQARAVNSSTLLKEPHLKLNSEQEAAVKAVRFKQATASLLHGATGSGKTEVYLQLCAQALEADKQVLILVPEIGLSPQTVGRFRSRFNSPLVELHSGISEAQRARNWLDAKNGHARIIIGTRLAALSPVKELGLIIVDEEHDNSYKQQDGLRYSARDLCVYRAHKLNIPIVLGSATPSLETLKQTLNKHYQHIVLKQRAAGTQAPELRCLDLKDQPQQAGLCAQSLTAIKQTLGQGKQVLVFQNRRGYAAVQLCHHCGWMSECPRCSASMTLHSRPARLHCHHCDWRTRPAQQCPNCQHDQLESRGIGTEQIEQELNRLFEDSDVIRIDRDSSRSKKAFTANLERIHSGKPCILVGTQMLAKGHHFKNLALVIITDADQGFLSPDFRGMEKMGQLLMQVAGRAGREQERGLVLLQSHRPEHPLLQLLCQRGYYNFARQLLAERQHNRMPPYSHLALFKAECKRPENATALLEHIAALYQRNNPPSAEHSLLGPMPCAMERIQDRYRFQLLIKSQSRTQLRQITSPLVEAIENNALSKRVRWSLDIDPQESN
ncbi:primosomal protein N' [Agaribacterium sp. ZY112]|uniref:primosomal protein N' n=1 Tax=Agaribacterium sp. ZY112 TaxID=3233574 RepID=UPI003525542E